MALRPGSPLPLAARTLPTVCLARDYDPAAVAARVRSGTWTRAGRGAYVPTSPAPSRRQLALARIIAVHENLRTPHWFSHESAALVWGLPLWRDPPTVHVRQAGHASSQRDRRVSRHRGEVDEQRLTTVAGLPVTDLEQTMVDCSRLLSALPALVVADAATRAGADRDVVSELLTRLAGRAGVARARTVLDLADEGAESPGETATRFVLLREGLPRPQTQIAVPTRLGTFWADLGWDEWHVLLEYDGRSKYTGPEDLVREKRRQDAVLDAGYRMLRVTKEDVRAGSALAARAAALLPTPIPRSRRPLLRG